MLVFPQPHSRHSWNDLTYSYMICVLNMYVIWCFMAYHIMASAQLLWNKWQWEARQWHILLSFGFSVNYDRIIAHYRISEMPPLSDWWFKTAVPITASSIWGFHMDMYGMVLNATMTDSLKGDLLSQWCCLLRPVNDMHWLRDSAVLSSSPEWWVLALWLHSYTYTPTYLFGQWN